MKRKANSNRRTMKPTTTTTAQQPPSKVVNETFSFTALLKSKCCNGCGTAIDTTTQPNSSSSLVNILVIQDNAKMPTTNLLEYAKLEMNPDSQRVNVNYDEMIHVDDGFMDEELSFYFDSFSSSSNNSDESSSIIRRTTPGRRSKLATLHSTPPPPTRRRKRSGGGGGSGGSFTKATKNQSKSESRWCCEETSCLSPGLIRPRRRPAITTTTDTAVVTAIEQTMILRSPIGRKQTPKQLQRKSLISQPTTRRNSFVGTSRPPPTSPSSKNTKNQNAKVHLSDAAKRTFVIPRMNSRSPAQDIVHRKRIIQ